VGFQPAKKILPHSIIVNFYWDNLPLSQGERAG